VTKWVSLSDTQQTDESGNNDMINAAVFGAGRIGKVHTHNIASLPGVALRYVVDVNPVAASELAGIYGAKPATIEAALGDPEVHAVGHADSRFRSLPLDSRG
jgi:hypothetical protein